MPYPSGYQASTPWTQGRQGICHVTYEQGKPHRGEGEEEQESTHQPHPQSHDGEPTWPSNTVCHHQPRAHTDATTPAKNTHCTAGLRQPHVGKWEKSGGEAGHPGRAGGGGYGRVEHEVYYRGSRSRRGGVREGRERGEEGGVHAIPPLPSHHAPSLATVNIVPILVFCLRTRT